MKHWNIGKLSDLCILKRGYDLPIYAREQGNVPIYSSSGISGYHNESKCISPGVITGRYGTIGTVFFAKDDFWPLNTTLFVENFNGNDEKFIYYFLKTLEWEKYNDKSAVPGINRNDVYKETIYYPDVKEQKAIAAVLGSLDDKIDLLQRQNATLEAMAETLFRERFISYSHKDSMVAIDSYILFNPKRSIRKGDMSPYLEMSNLRTDAFCPIEFYDKEFTSGSKFINGDTLLARITPCLENGKKCFVNFLEDGAVAWGSTEYIVMHPMDELHPLFAYCLVKTDDFRGYAESCLSGSSGRQRVDVTHLKQYEIKSPRKNDINDFNRFCTAIEPKLLNNYKKIKTLEKLRDTLLPKLMSGEVRVRVDG